MFSDRLAVKFKSAFPSLKHRNFRYYWFGMIVSLVGTWMQNIGQSWMVFTITKSPFLLGLVGTLQFLPMLLFSLFAGVIIEKLHKKKILVITQSCSMGLAFIMALLVFTGYIRYWHILILATLLGFINTFDMPTRQSFIIDLVGKEDLINAISLNSAVFNAARIVGPALAGLLMGYIGIAFCFAINAVSFIPVIVGLLKIDIKPLMRGVNNKKGILKDARQGLVYITSREILYRTIISVTVISIFAVNFSVLVPVLVKDVLNHGEAGYGFLMSIMGIGSLAGAMTTAVGGKAKPSQLMLILNPFCVAAIFIVIGFTKLYYLVAILLAAAGFFNTSFFITANSTLQVNAEDEYRGRVTSVYTLVFGGTTPIGNFITGGIAEKLGPGIGFLFCGVLILFFNLTLLFMENKNVFVKNSD